MRLEVRHDNKYFRVMFTQKDVVCDEYWILQKEINGNEFSQTPSYISFISFGEILNKFFNCGDRFVGNIEAVHYRWRELNTYNTPDIDIESYRNVWRWLKGKGFKQ